MKTARQWLEWWQSQDAMDENESAEMIAMIQRDALEAAAKVAKQRKDEARGVIDMGKGEWGTPGYIRDEDWARLQREEQTSASIERAIRALMPKESGNG